MVFFPLKYLAYATLLSVHVVLGPQTEQRGPGQQRRPTASRALLTGAQAVEREMWLSPSFSIC